eukprot:1160766-Pelagomonas_calceolata.AAC.5
MLLEASNWAPTHNLTQPWRFVVLGGSSKNEFEQLTIELVEKYTEVEVCFVPDATFRRNVPNSDHPAHPGHHNPEESTSLLDSINAVHRVFQLC